jgi:hypothetical protein
MPICARPGCKALPKRDNRRYCSHDCHVQHAHDLRFAATKQGDAIASTRLPSPSNNVHHRRIRDEQLRMIRAYLDSHKGERMTRTIARVALTVGILFGIAAVSSAQPKPPAAPARRAAATQSAGPVRNPSGVMFTCPDHALDDGHEEDIVDSVTGVVVQTIQGGDPAADAQGNVSIALNVQPVKFGTYTFVVRAKAGALMSPNSVPSDVWQRSPGQPGQPIPK